MGALPKRKISKGRRNRRRAHHRLKPMQLVVCSNCGEMRPSHQVCPHCGYYKESKVIDIEEK
jgi:large subunit ribosomal protein L32